MIIWIPLLVSILGAFVYILATNAKAAELGRLAFWTGLLVTLFLVAGHSASVLR